MKLIKQKLSGFTLILFMVVGLNSYSQSQRSMTANASDSYKKADKELNVVYQKILKEYASKPTFIKNLKTAQRLWVQLRGAELATRYPTGENYGSAGPMCKASYLENLTRERTKFLKVWLDGIPEGDVCNGSVKIGR